MTPPAPGRPLAPPEIPDSAAIVRIDLATRQLDTLASIRTPKVKFDVIIDEGRTSGERTADYKPPFFGAVRADRDGHLWIRTIPTEAIQGGPVYDVVNDRGELVERVQVPEGRTVIGFGEGGVVYLTGPGGWC